MPAMTTSEKTPLPLGGEEPCWVLHSGKSAYLAGQLPSSDCLLGTREPYQHLTGLGEIRIKPERFLIMRDCIIGPPCL